MTREEFLRRLDEQIADGQATTKREEAARYDDPYDYSYLYAHKDAVEKLIAQREAISNGAPIPPEPPTPLPPRPLPQETAPAWALWRPVTPPPVTPPPRRNLFTDREFLEQTIDEALATLLRAESGRIDGVTVDTYDLHERIRALKEIRVKCYPPSQRRG